VAHHLRVQGCLPSPEPAKVEAATQAAIDADPGQPGSLVSESVGAAPGPPGTHQDVLDGVLSLYRVAQDRIGNTEEMAGLAPGHRLEACVVAFVGRGTLHGR